MILSQQFHQLESDTKFDNEVSHKTKQEHLKILKSYYNKDASASVTKSLMTIHDTDAQQRNTINDIINIDVRLNETSSLSSVSSTSVSNKIPLEPRSQNLIGDYETSLTSVQQAGGTSASCLLFLNNLVEKNLSIIEPEQITQLKLSQSEHFRTTPPTVVDKFKNNLTLKSLKNSAKHPAILVKRFSLKNFKYNKSDENFNVKKAEKSQPKASKSQNLIENNSLHQLSFPSQVKKVKGSELSNSSSSYSNISSSNLSQASQALYHLTEENTQESFQAEYKNNPNDQLDLVDSRMSHHVNQTKPQAINSSHTNHNQLHQVSYNNNNYFNQNLLLSKKLRKYLPNNIGIRNHGNTCFMNCILQCLFHTSPLADFFITEQFEQDMQVITHQKSVANAQANSKQNHLPQFLLTKHFNRLLNSMWRNTYDSSYSHEFKQLVSHFNQTFSGGTQNDSHEFCVWLLDRLSQELSLKLPSKVLDPELNAPQQPATSSFVEELFQVEFKSTVICSKCNYKSSKYETDMMLSLPIPQNQELKTIKSSPKRHRRSLFPYLILANQTSIKQIIQTDSTGQQSDTTSKSKFYVSPTQQANNSMSSDLTNSAANYSTPFHVKIGCNIQINSIQSDFVTSNLSDSSNGYSITNPSIGDLRQYIASTYHLRQSDLVFINLNHIENNLIDNLTVEETFFIKPHQTSNLSHNSNTKTQNLINSMCIVELNSPIPNKTEPPVPLLNIIGINVYYEQNDGTNINSKRLICYGLPFVLLINRDCTYSELCRKLLESQSKYFKDKNMLKYKDLVEKLFTLSLNDSNRQVLLNSGDELPLYAECVERAINQSQQDMSHGSNIEYIKLNIEWKSFDGISNLFKDIDYGKADYVHKSVENIQKYDLNNLGVNDESGTDSGNHFTTSPQSQQNPSTKVTTATLDDCFDLFTEHEHLTDENSWMCPKCQKQTDAFKNLCISQVPPILIIHLKRFFYKSKTSNFKLTTPIWFPVQSLDISKYIDKSGSSKSGSDHGENTSIDDRMSSDFEVDYDITDSKFKNENKEDDEYMYDLIGVANHKGTNMANGHYTAYCKNLVDTKWYCFDDTSCTPINDSNTPNNNIFNNGSNGVWTENAYILFYKKRNCMRNERWWTSYVDRSLYDHDEFDRFLHNLDQIEKEQKKNQEGLQVQQLKQHRLTNKVQIISKNNLNASQSSAALFRKHTGFNKIRNMLSNTTSIGSNKKESVDESNPQVYTSIEVKHYDENIKPNRLLKQNNREQQSPSSIKSYKETQPQLRTVQQQQTNNILTMNTITILPSSDSNSSLDNSLFTENKPQTGPTNGSKINCFNNQVEPKLSNDSYEKQPSARISNESNQLLYKYPADNDYNFQLATKSQSLNNDQKISPEKSKNIYEFQPKHHKPPKAEGKRSKNFSSPSHSVKNRSPSSNSSISSKSTSIRSASRSNASSSRYINPGSIETPI